MKLNYRHWIRKSLLREETGPILSESVLQQIWFEQLLQNPLQTLSGEKVFLHHPGVWNHRAGPDFLRASFSLAEGNPSVGDVELHRISSDWNTHAHAGNPAYRNVRLHVFWQAHPGRIDPPVPGIHQIAIAHQLTAPLTELVLWFRSTPMEIQTGEKPGACHPQLLSLSPETLREILEEAGWHRLRQRRSLAQARITTLGLSQAAWIALAEGLGFAENREPFATLARAVPIARLTQRPEAADRAALLYGTSGLLPDPTRSPVSPAALPWIRQLWERWWQLGDDGGASVLPAGSWRLGSTRPHNSPLRRLAACVALSAAPTWQSLVEAIRAGQADKFLAILRSASDPFWDRHDGWGGRILGSSSRLIGPARAWALLFQVLAPLTDLGETELARRMESWPAGGEAGLLRSASVRLLGTPTPPAEARTHLAREGLLQIYKDFCRARPCRECGFPKFLAEKRRVRPFPGVPGLGESDPNPAPPDFPPGPAPVRPHPPSAP